jgi:maltokinase
VKVHVHREPPPVALRGDDVEPVLADAVAHVVDIEAVVDSVDRFSVEAAQFARRQVRHERSPGPHRNPRQWGETNDHASTIDRRPVQVLKVHYQIAHPIRGGLTTTPAGCLLWRMTIPQAPARSTAWVQESSRESEVVGAWMARQRWYANKGALPVLEKIGSWDLSTDLPGVEIVTHLYIDHTVGKPALYQVPLTRRAAPLGNERALVGEVDGALVYDGPHDPAYTAALLAFMRNEDELTGDRTWLLGNHAAQDGDTSAPLVSRVLTGEQSNTSIIYEADAAAAVPVILKLFRAIHDGQNPDVVLQTALAAAGSEAVPRPVGNVLAEWDDRGQPTGRARGHLAFAQEFLPGAEDAWRVALSAAEHDVDFSAEAHALGVATAGVHATLAATLATQVASQADIDAVVQGMHGRLASAIAEVPELAGHAAAIEAVFATAAHADWPAQQRIHGDLHLGQVLAVPGRGWVLVDFEGEPLRPMRERSQLDSPMRDVAGMLRSFDYVAGSIVVAGGDANEWAALARAAFERGYSEASGCDLVENRALVEAFEIDKALYETVYEARNRPDWLRIPVEAIERLASRGATPGLS